MPIAPACDDRLERPDHDPDGRMALAAQLPLCTRLSARPRVLGLYPHFHSVGSAPAARVDTQRCHAVRLPRVREWWVFIHKISYLQVAKYGLREAQVIGFFRSDTEVTTSPSVLYCYQFVCHQVAVRARAAAAFPAHSPDKARASGCTFSLRLSQQRTEIQLPADVQRRQRINEAVERPAFSCARCAPVRPPSGHRRSHPSRVSVKRL